MMSSGAGRSETGKDERFVATIDIAPTVLKAARRHDVEVRAFLVR